MKVDSVTKPCAWLAVAFLLVFPHEASAQSRLEGTVLTAAGAPLVDATVVVTGAELRAPLTTRTDRAGRYAFENIKAGIRVRVTVTAAGRPPTVTYGLVTSWIETLDIKLPADIETPTTAADLNPAGGAAGEVRGIVRDADGSSIAGARIYVDDTPAVTTTDSAGRFTFGKLRAGLRLQLRVIADGYETITDQVSVPVDSVADLEFSLGPAQAAIDRGIESPVADLSRTARFMTPRAMTSDSQATNYEGFHWYSSSRLFLNLGGLDPEPIDGIRPRGHLGGAFEASAFGTAGDISVPVRDRGIVSFAARRSLPGTLHEDVLDVFDGGTGTAVRDRAPRGSSGVFQAPNAPGFADVNARLQLTPGRHNRVWASFYDARDDSNYSRDQAGRSDSSDLAIPDLPELPADTRIEAGDVQRWKGRGASLIWGRDWSPAVTTTAAVAVSRFAKSHDQAFFLTEPDTGADFAIAAGRETSSGLLEENEIRDTTVKFGAVLRAGFRHAVDVNAEIATLESTATSSIEASRPDDNLPREATVLTPLLQRTTIGKTFTLSAQDTWRPAGRLVVAPGVRLAHYDLTSATYVDPRVTASYPVAPRVELSGTWSIDHQFASRVTREDREHGDGEFWVVADGSQVPVSRVLRFGGGFTVTVPGVRVDTRLFYKRFDDLSLFAFRPLTGVAPAPATAQSHVGSGSAAGIEVEIEQQSRRNGLRASYTLGRSEYLFPTLDAAAFPGSDDESHRLRVADTVPIRAGWSVGGAWVIAQGRPFTPLQNVQQVWFPAGDLAYQALFGTRNSARLPLYHRLDLSTQIDRRFGAVSSTLGVTVFNVYDRDNVLFYDYQAIGSAASVSSILMMRRAVNVFFRIGF